MTEQEYKEHIYKKSSTVKNKEELQQLITEIIEFKHDYGTIVYGCMAAIKGAFNVINRSDSGGITGFQAGCLAWECIHEFTMIKYPAKIVNFNDMLYPQYHKKFDKVIPQKAWDYLQQQAKELLEKSPHADPMVIAHWKKCASGELPFGFRIEND